MRNIADIYIMLSFFVYIIACSIIYIISKDLLSFRFNKKVKKIKPEFEEVILKNLNTIKSNEAISKMDIAYVREKLKQKPYIKVFNDTIKEFNKLKENQIYTKLYIENFEDIINKNIKRLKLKDNTIKTYVAVSLGEYKISNYEISEFLLNCIKSKSIYLKVASLESISKIGNIQTLKRAINYISNEECYINNKVFTDIISQFGSDKELLDEFLIKNFGNFNESIQVVAVEHFKNNKIEFVKEELFKYLNEGISKEVDISIIKYFSNIKFEACKYKLIQLLNSNDWEYRAICSKALSNYKCNLTKEELLKSINDKNWHVRLNSAISILEFNDESLIDYILENDDNYAKDILFYAMFMDERLSYEDYLEKSGKLEVEYQC